MSTRQILLVEDNPDDAELTVAALKHHFSDIAVETVEDGVEALEFLTWSGPYQSRARTLPRLVLLDLNLPRMDGHEVLSAIRADPRTRHLPVVILTSSREEEDVHRSYVLGVNSYVQKPVDFDDFSMLAERLGRYWLDLNCVSPEIADGPR